MTEEERWVLEKWGTPVVSSNHIADIKEALGRAVIEKANSISDYRLKDSENDESFRVTVEFEFEPE